MLSPREEEARPSDTSPISVMKIGPWRTGTVRRGKLVRELGHSPILREALATEM